MDRLDGAVLDLERAVDQLVDEIAQRQAALHALFDDADRDPRLGPVRRDAAGLVDQLTGPQAGTAALAVARALWPPQGAPVPAWWWTTPLGIVITTALS